MGKAKQKLTLSVDKEVIEKAKVLGINISDITERVLTGYTSAEKPEGNIHEAYNELFDSILPLLKEFDVSVKVAESWIEVDAGHIYPQDETFLNSNGNFLVVNYVSSDESHLSDIKKIPPEEFLSAREILSNLVNEMAQSHEKRKAKMDEILMAKRIIEAMSESLLKKQPTIEK